MMVLARSHMHSPAKKKRILLIQCGFDRREMASAEPRVDAEFGFIDDGPIAPLGCATIAALTSDAYEVHIWDEERRGQLRANTPLEHYDIIGISLLFSSLGYQARFLGLHLKRPGTVVVAGGPGISSAPEEFRDFFDAIFVNEAERTWPQFLRDYEQGTVRKEYRQIEKPELSESPPPKWGAIAEDLPRYEWASVQTTRGCPFDCEFCDVIYLFGRKQRHKPVEQIVEEVRALEGLKARGIFFADDEFVGDAGYTKRLLEALVPVNNGFVRPLRFFTQATLNMSKDERLLELMADANFYAVLLGIESFSNSSLKETHKYQNIRADLVGDLRKLQSYGIGARGSFIVGFDHDGPETFEELYQGIQRSCIPWPTVGPLHAHQQTRLWRRLRTEGRVVYLRPRQRAAVPKIALNIIPKRMSRVELLQGCHDLITRLLSWESACARIRGWAAGVHRLPRVEEVLLKRSACERLLREAEQTWGLTPGDRTAIADTLEETLRLFPQLINRVVFFLLKIHNERQRFAHLYSNFEQWLEAERSGELVPEQRPLLVPPDFEGAIAGVFPELYARLHQRLPDKGLIAEAAREVLVDFVVRWGTTFQKVEPQHRSFLLELCDRAAAKLGGHPEPLVKEDVTPLLAEARKGRLLDAVLKDVRDELASMSAS